MAGPELVGIGRQVPVEGDEPATGLDRGPRGAERRDGVRELVEGVLEVGERRLALVTDGGDVALLDGDPVRRARLPRRPRAPGRRSPARTRSRSARCRGSGAPSRSASGRHRSGRRGSGSRAGGRSRAAGPPAAPPGRTRRCPGRSAARWPAGSDRAATPPGRPSGGRPARSPKSRLPMAAWRNWPPRYSGRFASSRMPATSSGIRSRSSSSSMRSCAPAPQAQRPIRAGSVPVRRASSSAVMPGGPGLAQARRTAPAPGP